MTAREALEYLISIGVKVSGPGGGPYTLTWPNGEVDEDLTAAVVVYIATQVATQDVTQDVPDIWPANQPWPPKKFGVTGVNPNGEPTYGKVIDWETYLAALQEERQRQPEVPEVPVGTVYKTYGEAYEALPDGYHIVPKTLSDGSTVYGFEQDDPETKQGEIVTIGGDQFIRQPNGFLTPYTKEQRTLDQYIEDLIINATGPEDFAKAYALDDARDRLNEKKLTPQDAFNLIAPIAQNPTHFAELWDSLAQATQRVATPTYEQMTAPTAPNTLQAPLGAGTLDFSRTGTAQGVTGSKVFPGNMTPAYSPWASPESRDIRPGETFEEWQVRTGTASQFGMTAEQVAAAQGMEQAGGLEAYLRQTQKKAQGMSPEEAAWVADARSKGVTEDIIQSRLARARAFRAQAEAAKMQPAPGATGVNVPPPGWGTSRYVPNDQWNAMTPEQREAFMESTPTPTPISTPISTPTQQVKNPFMAAVKQEPAFGGTPFYPIPKGNPWQEMFTRGYNERQQDIFKRRRVPTRGFR